MIIIRDDNNEIVEMFDTAKEFKQYIDYQLAEIEIKENVLLFSQDKPYRDVYRDVDFGDKIRAYLEYHTVGIEVI